MCKDKSQVGRYLEEAIRYVCLELCARRAGEPCRHWAPEECTVIEKLRKHAAEAGEGEADGSV